MEERMKEILDYHKAMERTPDMAALSAMQEYAKEVGQGFAEWVFAHYNIDRYHHDKWMWQKLSRTFTNVMDLFTTEQLYELYLQSIKEK